MRGLPFSLKEKTMSNSVFIHIMASGDVWISNNLNDTPAGTIAATIKCNSDAKFQKVATISGTFPNATSTGHTGKFGNEKS